MRARIAVSALTLSAAGFVGLIAHEGFTDRAVVPVKGDRPTVGFGSTFRDDGTPVRMGDTITAPAAVLRSFNHIAKDETKLKQCVTAPLFQHEYDVLMDHAYQYGSGVTCDSSMVRLANAGDYEGSCKAYLAYRFMTSSQPHAGWEPYRFDGNGKPIRWRFDCTTPGNKVCAGVGKRATDRMNKCMGGG